MRIGTMLAAAMAISAMSATVAARRQRPGSSISGEGRAAHQGARIPLLQRPSDTALSKAAVRSSAIADCHPRVCGFGALTGVRLRHPLAQAANTVHPASYDDGPGETSTTARLAIGPDPGALRSGPVAAARISAARRAECRPGGLDRRRVDYFPPFLEARKSGCWPRKTRGKPKRARRSGRQLPPLLDRASTRSIRRGSGHGTQRALTSGALSRLIANHPHLTVFADLYGIYDPTQRVHTQDMLQGTVSAVESLEGMIGAGRYDLVQAMGLSGISHSRA
jgi:hypothetical protein